MRIFGGSDYYDGAMAQLYASGYDPKIILHRYKHLVLEDKQAETLKIPSLIESKSAIEYNILYPTSKAKHKERLAVHTGRLIFCGKLYNFLKVLRGDKYSFIWTMEEAKPLLEDIEYIVTRDRFWLNSFRKREKISDFKDFFEPKNLPDPEGFMNERITILLLYPLHKRRITTLNWEYGKYQPLVNPFKLGDLQFYKKLDPWTAAQEISMWVGNLGSPERNMVELDNDTRAAKHGMDETSFRRDTHASKPRKQKKTRKKKK